MNRAFLMLLVVICFNFFLFPSLDKEGLGAVEVKAATLNFERLFYFVEGEQARKSFFAHPETIDILAPQNYQTDARGNLVGTVKADLLDFAKRNGIRVMPLLTNGAFSQKDGHGLLENSSRQKKLIKKLIQEAKGFDYIGWQIDFEQMTVDYREDFSQFIERIYPEFKKNNLQLSVAVIAQVSENPADYPRNLWSRIIGVYDYARLASSTDFISIMSYDDPTSLGPVAGWAWYNRVLNFTLTKIPPEKISFGLGLYYWRWDDAAMKRVGIGGNKHLVDLQKDHKIKFGWNADEHAPYFHFWDKGKSYTGWYENRKSVEQKISLITGKKLRGFSAWALGLETPSVYSVMK